MVQTITITKRTLKKIGNSYFICIPKDFVESSDIFANINQFSVTLDVSEQTKLTDIKQEEKPEQERLFYVSVSQSFEHMVWGEL